MIERQLGLSRKEFEAGIVETARTFQTAMEDNYEEAVNHEKQLDRYRDPRGYGLTGNVPKELLHCITNSRLCTFGRTKDEAWRNFRQNAVDNLGNSPWIENKAIHGLLTILKSGDRSKMEKVILGGVPEIIFWNCFTNGQDDEKRIRLEFLFSNETIFHHFQRQLLTPGGSEIFRDVQDKTSRLYVSTWFYDLLKTKASGILEQAVSVNNEIANSGNRILEVAEKYWPIQFSTRSEGYNEIFRQYAKNGGKPRAEIEYLMEESRRLDKVDQIGQDMKSIYRTFIKIVEKLGQ